jgi:hypothetical protein
MLTLREHARSVIAEDMLTKREHGTRFQHARPPRGCTTTKYRQYLWIELVGRRYGLGSDNVEPCISALRRKLYRSIAASNLRSSSSSLVRPALFAYCWMSALWLDPSLAFAASSLAFSASSLASSASRTFVFKCSTVAKLSAAATANRQNRACRPKRNRLPRFAPIPRTDSIAASLSLMAKSSRCSSLTPGL